MSIESNKVDFELALESMKETLELLDHSTDCALMDTLKSVVEEYENHYSPDIQELIDENLNMEDKLEQYRSAEIEKIREKDSD